MSEPTDPIPALLTQVDNVLHQLSPPIPQLVWGEGVVQSRHVLQQVRDYLISLRSPLEVTPEVEENIPPASPQRVTQQLNHLQREVEALQQERHRLMAEIQQLQIQSQSANADYSNASSSVALTQGAADLADVFQPHPGESWPTSHLSAGITTQKSTDLSEDLSDIFGELQLNEIPSLDGLESPAMTETASHSVLDTAIHLDSSEPSLDGQEYILASPHESLLPIDEDEDQIDSLLLVGRSTVQRLETELMSLEKSLTLEDDLFPQESDPDHDSSLKTDPSLQQLAAQFEQNRSQSGLLSNSTPLTFEALLHPSQENGIPFPRTAHPEAESFSLKTLSQKFSQSSPPQNSQKPRQSED